MEIYQKVNPSVVTIFTIGFNGKTIQQGSGVVINKDGWIVTNFHVFNGGKSMMVKQGERLLTQSDIIGVDVDRDLLILKVIPKYFSFVEPGDATNLNVGQKVYTIGSPLGYENTLSAGLISGVRAMDEKGVSYLQFSAPISAGSSGGAVVNEWAEVIGISTKTIEGSQNLNFAVPINEILNIQTVDFNDKTKLDAFNHFWIGRSAYNFQNYKLALENYHKTVELQPDFKSGYFVLANTYIKTKEYLTAITYLEKALEIDSSYANIYNNLAVCFDYLGVYQNAIQNYQKSLSINPKDPAIYSNIGTIYSEQFKDFNTAIQYYQKALEVDPNFVLALINIGDAYANRRDFQSAIEVLERATHIESEEPFIYSNLAECYYRLGDYRNTIKNCKKTLKLDNTDEYEFHFLADVYFKIDDFGEALDNYRRVIFINPNNAAAHYFTALSYKNLGNKILYKKYLQKAIEIDPLFSKKKNVQLMIDIENQ